MSMCGFESGDDRDIPAANVYTEVEIALRTALQKLFKAYIRVLGRKVSEECNNKIRVEDVGVRDDSLHIAQILVVLQSMLEEALSLTEHGNLLFVEMVPNILGENSISHLWTIHQVELKDLEKKGRTVIHQVRTQM